MVSQVAERKRLRTHRVAGGWLITSMECAGAMAVVEESSGVADVLVADGYANGGPDPDCFAAAACTPDGDVLVISRQSPPALLVTHGDKRATPAHPLGRELVHLYGMDKLLMLSPALFEVMPEVLARTLHATPMDLLAADPASLLSEIFTDVHAGSGVIIGRNPHPDRTGGPL